MSKPNKTWEFTIFDYVRYDIINFIKRLEWNRAIFSEEFCPTTRNMYLKGIITFNRAYRKAGVLKLFGDAADPEWIKNVTVIATKCPRDWNYCKKSYSVIVIDEDRGKQGKRNDLEECYKLWAADDKEKIKKEHLSTFIRYNKNIINAVALLKVPRSEPPDVI